MRENFNEPSFELQSWFDGSDIFYRIKDRARLNAAVAAIVDDGHSVAVIGSNEAVLDHYCRMMTALLRSAVLQGTARGLADWGIYFPVAGKTGTTNNSRDAWFVGYTPDILILVWVGYDSGASIHASGAGAAFPARTMTASMLAAATRERRAESTAVSMPGKVRATRPGTSPRTGRGSRGRWARAGYCPATRCIRRTWYR